MAREPLRTDIAAAARRAGSSVWGCGREVRRLGTHLGRGEKVRRIAGARYQGKIGVLALTDRRLLFIVEGRFRRICDEFPYSRLERVDWSSFWGAGTITVHAAGGAAVISGIGEGAGHSIVQSLRHQIARLDARRQQALDRADRLYGMVEFLYGLHVPNDTAAITDGELSAAAEEPSGEALRAA